MRMSASITQEEIAAAIILPHFRAVQDIFSVFRPEPKTTLKRLEKTKFVIDPEIHNTKRHFAATRDDGLLMLFAPEIVNLPTETLVAILSHEFGHAADFIYPSRWYTPSGGPTLATWIAEEGVDGRSFRIWSRLWEKRNRDQVEWAADGIVEAVTGHKLTYCGDCMLQCFGGGEERPAGLR